jgi:DNA repair protein RecN (Recombination protein N)
MLISLAIYDFVIIERLEMSFARGFSVLTGETGAGKSILLDALGIALGRRGEAGLIRKGADQAIIAVEFQPESHHPVWTILADQGINHDGTLLIRRILSTTGRHRSFVNDQMVSSNLLRQLGDHLVEIHAQHDRLLDTAKHRELLDEFVNDRQHLMDVAQLFKEWRYQQQALDAERERFRQLQRDEEFHRLQLQDLEKLNLRDGEEAELLAERQQLAHLGKLWDVMLQTEQQLQGNSLLETVHSALKILHRSQIQDNPALVAATQALEKAASELTEAQSQLEDIQLQFQGQPQRLQQIDDRLHLLRSTARKYQLTIDQLPEFYQRLHRDLANLAASEQRLDDMAFSVDQAKQAYIHQAQALFLKRQQAAAQLDTMVMAELPDLHLPNAQFKTAVIELPEEHWHEKGIDRINFLVAMNRGQDLCSLEKAASGGELARLMLSLKAVLTSHSMLPTIVFDEIDIGVGGAVAAAIGQRLRRLADHVQVLSITHSPQVAAAGAHHFHVTKQDLGYRVGTEVILLPFEQRSEEIARMLSGAEVTHEARAVAQTLLKKYA